MTAPFTREPFMRRARKAVNAGVLAAGGALGMSVVTAVQTAHVPQTFEGWSALVLAAVGVGLVTGWRTYSVRNAGQAPGGSDPAAAGERMYRSPLPGDDQQTGPYNR